MAMLQKHNKTEFNPILCSHGGGNVEELVNVRGIQLFLGPK